MSTTSFDERLRNILVILLLVTITLVTACAEGYLEGNQCEGPRLVFWLVWIGGILLLLWLAMTITVRRLLAFIVVIFIIEYIKETLGTRLGLWTYQGHGASYIFGVWLWVAAALTVYVIASKVVVRLTRKSWFTLPRPLNPVIVLLCFVVIVMIGDENLFKLTVSKGATTLWTDVNMFWLFYVVLLVIGVLASLWSDARVLVGILIATFIVGYIGESTGAAAGIFQFKGSNPTSPPGYLIFGCWPLEIIAQMAITAVIAGEALVVVPRVKERAGSGPSQGPGSGVKVSARDARDKKSGGESSADGPSDEDSEQSGSKSSGPGCTDHPPARMQCDRDSEYRPLTSDEQVLRGFLLVSSIVYLVAGFLFGLFPDGVLEFIERFRYLAPGTLKVTETKHLFWTSMTFSMMMCISFLAFYAQYNIRKNKFYVVPLLIAKFASSSSALFYFIFFQKYFAYFVIFIVDDLLFWLTLFFYIRAQRPFFEKQTAYLWKKPHDIRHTGPTTVASFKGTDKFDLLKQVLEATEFERVLNERFEQVNKEHGTTKEDFLVAIKPNFMFTHAKADHTTYTDPELVEALIDEIVKMGFPRIKVVESRSTLGKYYANRTVRNMAKHLGYSEKNYEVVDLTDDQICYDYGGRLGWHYIGKTWKDADFRISFAKNKTHVFDGFTLTLKNVFGCLPVEDKLKEYHYKREMDWPTIESLKPENAPVHFGLIDAIYSADGQFGVMTDPEANPTDTIIGGENIIAVDWVGAKKMGLNPDCLAIGRYYHLAVRAFGKPEVNWVGDRSVYEPWANVSVFWMRGLDLMEEANLLSDWFFSIISANEAAFPFKINKPSVLFFRWLARPFKRLFYRHDVL